MATMVDVHEQRPHRKSVFLCHAKEDEADVLKIYAELNQRGFAPWIDCMDLLPGQNWQEEIPRVIEASDFMLVFLSENSIQKRGYVQKEFRLAEDVHDNIPQGKIFLIPVLLSACEVPARFKHLHCAKLYERDGMAKLLTSLGCVASVSDQTGHAGLLNRMHELNRELRSLEANLLALPEAFHPQAEQVGASINSGIVKLLPRGLYSQVMRLSGGGAYYSFARKSHEYGQSADVELQGNSLTVGFAGMDYGFFVSLGSGGPEQLKQIGKDFPEWCGAEKRAEWDFAWNYQPPSQRIEVRKAFRDFRVGTPVGSTLATSRIGVDIGAVFLLRSINYRGRKGEDVLVALFCAEKLEDESIILIWNLLRQQEASFPQGPDEKL